MFYELESALIIGGACVWSCFLGESRKFATMLRYGKLRIVIRRVAIEKCPNNEKREIPTKACTASDTLIKLLSAKTKKSKREK